MLHGRKFPFKVFCYEIARFVVNHEIKLPMITCLSQRHALLTGLETTHSDLKRNYVSVFDTVTVLRSRPLGTNHGRGLAR